jgi:hypothetical protein
MSSEGTPYSQPDSVLQRANVLGNTQSSSEDPRHEEPLLRISDIERMLKQYANLVPKADKDSPIKELVHNSAQVLALCGVGIYGAIRFGQQLYCNKLGITPEEIDLTYTASISRAAVILAALGFSLLLALIISGFAGIAHGTTRGAKFLQYSLTVLALVAIWSIPAILLPLLGFMAFLILSIAIIAVMIVWIIGVFVEARRIKKRQQRTRNWLLNPDPTVPVERLVGKHLRTAGFLLGISLVITLSFVGAGFSGSSYAESVKNGYPTQNEGLQLLGLKASIVRLTGGVPKDPDVSNRKLIYLGQNAKNIVLYDVACGQPLRIPNENITIAIGNEGKSYPAAEC